LAENYFILSFEVSRKGSKHNQKYSLGVAFLKTLLIERETFLIIKSEDNIKWNLSNRNKVNWLNL